MTNNNLWNSRRAVSMAAALLLALGLAACASPSGIAPQAQLLNTGSLNLAAAEPAQPIATDWWLAFGDPQLDTLIGQALAGNPSLRVAQARLARAQAVTEVADAALLPQVNGALDLTRQRYTANGAVPPPLGGSIRESGTLQLSTSWEIDFFGKNQAAPRRWRCSAGA